MILSYRNIATEKYLICDKIPTMISPEIINDFISAAAQSGLHITDPVFNGIWHRVSVDGDKQGRKSGSYFGLEDGGVFYGYFNNFKNPSISARWRFSDSTVSGSRLDVESWLKKQRARDAERLAGFVRVSDKIVAALDKLPLATAGFPYLKRKRVDAYGLYAYKNKVVMPLRDIHGRIWSAQVIYHDGFKKNVRGGRKVGCFHLIGEIDPRGVIMIAEGYATAATIHQFTGQPVAVAIDAGNLVRVAADFRRQYPNINIVICGDDDRFAYSSVAWRKDGGRVSGREMPNAGRVFATKAAASTGGVAVFPRFHPSDWMGTDFNDAQDYEKAFDELMLFAANEKSSPKERVNYPGLKAGA
jgi:phage/plasmid primase-like uncharacterized protein